MSCVAGTIFNHSDSLLTESYPNSTEGLAISINSAVSDLTGKVIQINHSLFIPFNPALKTSSSPFEIRNCSILRLHTCYKFAMTFDVE